MQLKNLRTLLIDELREIYYSESLIQEAFRRLVRGADGPQLTELFEKENTKSGEHMQRLEKIFELLHENPRGGRAMSVKALLTETEDRMAQAGDPHVIDAALIASAQRLAHWKIASYGTVYEWTALLGEPEAAQLLRANLDEQKGGDSSLSQLAEDINIKAKTSG